MWRKIFYSIAGIALVILGVILGRGNVKRGRVAGTQPDYDGIRQATDSASDGIADAQEHLAGSEDIIDRLSSSNRRSAALIARGRAILQAAAARDVGGGDS